MVRGRFGRTHQVQWTHNVVEIALDNSGLEMPAIATTSYERVARDSTYRLMETRARTQTGVTAI